MKFHLKETEWQGFQSFLESWERTHHKYRGLSDHLSELGEWGKGLQLWLCLALHRESLQKFFEARESDQELGNLYDADEFLALRETSTLVENWLANPEDRRTLEERALAMVLALDEPLQLFALNVDEAGGPARERALYALWAAEQLCLALASRSDSGDLPDPIHEMVSCVLAQIRSLELDAQSAKGRLISYLRASVISRA